MGPTEDESSTSKRSPPPCTNPDRCAAATDQLLAELSKKCDLKSTGGQGRGTNLGTLPDLATACLPGPSRDSADPTSAEHR